VSIGFLLVTGNFSSAFLIWIFYIAKPECTILVLFSLLIGYGIGKADGKNSIDAALLYTAMAASFFYNVS